MAGKRITSEILDRMPPNDPVAERSLLGSILLDHRVIADVRSIVAAADFHTEANRIIYQTMLAIEDDRGSIDTVTLVASLRAAGQFQAVGGDAYILEIFQSVAVAHHAEHYARIVAEHARRRAVIHAACEILRSAYDPASDPAELVATAQRILSGIEPSSGKGDPEPIGSAVIRAMQAIDAASEAGQRPGVLTGLYGFDDRFGGLGRGELVILAGRPGDGKTSLACQIADHVASRGRNVYFASLEMSNAELATRMLCSRAGVSNREIRSARITSESRRALVRAANAMPRDKLIIHDKARLSIYEIAHAARRVARDGIGLVVVDYLQRITPADRKIQRHEQIGEMTDGLKSLARELDCPVLCLAQLSRAAEADTAPRLSHLRESGSIEADADVVFFIRLHPRAGRDDGWWKDLTDSVQWNAELVIGKGRNIGRGIIRLVWEPRYTRFRCADEPQRHTEFDAFSGGFVHDN